MNPYIICPTQSRHKAGNVDYGIDIPRGLSPKFEKEEYVVLKPGVTVENPRATWAIIDDKVPLLVESSYFDDRENKFYYNLSLQCAGNERETYPDWHYCTNPAFELDTLSDWQPQDKLMLYAKNEERAKEKYANARGIE